MRKATISFVMYVCPYVCPHETTRLPLDVFSWNLIFQYFSKICRENSSFFKIWQEYLVLYMQTSINSWPYLAQFFLERKYFGKILRIKSIHTFYGQKFFFFRKMCRLWETVENFVEPDRPHIKIWHMHIPCWILKVTNTHSEYVILIAFPLQRSLHERATILRYTYTACLVTLLCIKYEGWNFNSGNYLFTTDTK